MQIHVNGTTLNYEVEGRAGAPWITFSNSLATTLHMWDEQAAALKGDFRILRFDNRGHGKSAAPKGPYTFEMLYGDVVGMWNSLDIEKSHFVGLSIGGMSGQGLALAHPDRLLTLTIANSASEGTPAFKAAWDARIAAAEKDGIEPLVEPTVQRWCSPGFYAANPPTLAKMRGMIRETTVAGYTGCGHAVKSLSYLSQISKIRTRTLLIAGRDDGATPPEGMKAIGAQIKGSKYVELAPAGHISAMEQPAAFTKALRDFIANA
jgi:3-oxoadipate enol-lactonase